MFQHLMVYSNYYKIKKSFNLRLYSDSFEPILLSIEISSNWFAEQNDFQIRLVCSKIISEICFLLENLRR